MATDIFNFWSVVAAGDMTHPADREVLARASHGFDLACLPAAFSGPLRNASIVLLYLSFGFVEADRAEAQS